MSETIEVTVKLPKPPEGWEYTGEHREPKTGESYAVSDGTVTTSEVPYGWISARYILRRVAPPERMVTLTLPEKRMRWLEGWLTDSQTKSDIRKALAEAQEPQVCGQWMGLNPDTGEPLHSCGLLKGHKEHHRPSAQEACGVPLCSFQGAWHIEHNPSGCNQPTKPCTLPKGHKEPHRP